MKNNYVKNIVLATALLLAGSSYQNNFSKDHNPDKLLANRLERIIEKDKIFERKILEQSSDEISAPQYRTPPDYCSRYAKIAAENLFGKEYVREKAWNLRYKNKIASPFKEDQNLKELVTNNILRPGMLIGIYNPKSDYNNKIDLEGNKAKYTHIATFLGINDSGELEFAHQFGKKSDKITEQELRKKKLVPKEIITTKNDKNYLAFLEKIRESEFESKLLIPKEIIEVNP